MRRFGAVILALAALLGPAQLGARDALAQPAAGALPAAAAQALPRGTLVSLQGTPHVWVADQQGALHWVGDLNAMVRHLAEERDAASQTLDPSDFVIEAVQHYFDIIPAWTLEQLRAAPRGEPWLTYEFVRLDGAIYLVRREIGRRGPLLRVQSPADLEVFGVTAGNYGGLVLDQGTWQQRYGIDLSPVPRAELRTALPPARTPPPCLPAVERIEVQQSGALAVVRNTCGQPLRVGLGAVLYGDDGRPLTTTSARRWDAPPADVREVALLAPTQGAASVQPLLDAAPLGPPGMAPPTICVEVGASRCLEMDPWLFGSVQVLQSVEDGPPLLRTAADFGVVLRHWPLMGARGQYEPLTRTVTIAESLDRYGDWERATVLSHELQHAADHAGGLLAKSAGDQCAGEAHAFRRNVQVWLELWQGNPPEPANEFQEELAEITEEVLNNPDPNALPQTLRTLHYDCALLSG